MGGDRNAGRLEAIYLKRSRGAPMEERPDAELVAGRGIVGNADQSGRRQVTLLELERWRSFMERFSASHPPSARRANLLLSGIDLRESRGRVLRIGGCRVRILGETKPCTLLDGLEPGLREAMFPEWGGGAFGEVLEDGRITVGDLVGWSVGAEAVPGPEGAPPSPR